MGNSPSQRRKKSPKPPPKCKAFLLCQGTIIEKESGNVSIINTFNAFKVAPIPGCTGPFYIFVQLTDGIGRYDSEIEIVDLADDRIIARATAPAKLEFPQKLMRMNVVIPVPPLPVRRAGSYEIRVLANKQVIEQQKFDVVSMEAVQ